MQTRDEALMADGRDEDDVPTRDLDLVPWFQRQHGRRPTLAELEDLRDRRARRVRRRILSWRRQGLTNRQVVDRLVVDLFASPEVVAGAAALAGTAALLHQVAARYLALSDRAGACRAEPPKWLKARKVLTACRDYANAKIAAEPMPESADFLPHYLRAGLNATDLRGLHEWAFHLGRLSFANRPIQVRALDELDAAGRAAVAANPNQDLAAAEPGPPRAVWRSRPGGDELEEPEVAPTVPAPPESPPPPAS